MIWPCQGTYDPNSAIATGIASSTAIASAATAHPMGIGYAEASALGAATFAGQSVDSTSMLLGYTFLGDANLDGTVNALDFNALANNYDATPGSDVWSQGDFNYDGTVNSSDFAMLAANYGQVMASSSQIASDAASLGSVVPEPASVAMLIAGAVLLRHRRFK